MREVVSELPWLYFYIYESSSIWKKVQTLSPAFSNLPNYLQKSPTKLTGRKEKDGDTFVFDTAQPNTRHNRSLCASHRVASLWWLHPGEGRTALVMGNSLLLPSSSSLGQIWANPAAPSLLSQHTHTWEARHYLLSIFYKLLNASAAIGTHGTKPCKDAKHCRPHPETPYTVDTSDRWDLFTFHNSAVSSADQAQLYAMCLHSHRGVWLPQTATTPSPVTLPWAFLPLSRTSKYQF